MCRCRAHEDGADLKFKKTRGLRVTSRGKACLGAGSRWTEPPLVGTCRYVCNTKQGGGLCSWCEKAFKGGGLGGQKR